MFGRAIPLFRVMGFSVKVDPSWLLAAVLITWSLAGALFPYALPERSRSTYVLMGACGALGLFASVVFHELSHSLVARRFGIEMKGITLFLFGGVAELGTEPKGPKSEWLMAAAGPVASVAAAFILRGVSYLTESEPVDAVLGYVAAMNLILAAFNLLPGLPLDGGRILRAGLWAWRKDLVWATRVAAACGAGLGAFMVGAGIVSLIMGKGGGGIWWVLLGLFLRGSAAMGYQRVLAESRTVRALMDKSPVVVPAEASLRELAEDYFLRYGRQSLPVVSAGRPLGRVTAERLRAAPWRDWAATPVSEIVEPAYAVPPWMKAAEALEELEKRKVEQLLVVEDDKLIGTIDAAALRPKAG